MSLRVQVYRNWGHLQVIALWGGHRSVQVKPEAMCMVSEG